MWGVGKSKPCALSRDINGAATMEKSMAVLQEIKIEPQSHVGTGIKKN